MPFSPTAPGEPDGQLAGDPAKRTETEARINEIGNTWRQEREVRLTAQRILAEHLRWDKAQRLTDPPNSRSWPDIRLDLVGATLIDFNLENGAMAEANFGGATFSGDAEFGGATFSRAWFDKAVFRGAAVFSGATFSRDAGFDKATFSRDAKFDKAAFSAAVFSGAVFRGSPQTVETSS